jgi:protein gp37
MCDVFDDHPKIVRERAKLWPLIRDTPHLTWQILTKRATLIEDGLPEDWDDGYKNVWLGVTIERHEYAGRATRLRRIPAGLRFVSCEPALGPFDLLELFGIGWVIYGGESGPKFRRHNVQWARDLRDRCREAGIPFFYKQSPARRPSTGARLDGKIVKEFPGSE